MNSRFLCCLVLAMVPVTASAVAPNALLLGSQLFEHEWQSQNPALGSDGLGPLFNATSCATCHRQGGVGGGGEAEFNAKSIGIESIKIQGSGLTSARLAEMISRFHPGFVIAEGSILNVLPLAHHGGTDVARKLHDAMTLVTSADYSESGGPIDASEVRIANASPIVFEQNIDGYQVRITARMYGRNTTALFGSGLIDRVPDKLLDRQVRIQQQHPEISGRPSTLPDGRYGKFGWRANVASLFEFNDQACANEMGLQTRRKKQSDDATNRAYSNASFDITDGQVEALTQFVAALPAPTRYVTHDQAHLASVRNGEAVFNRVGCAVCHVRDMGVAKGIYSDLLLHDMGSESIDLNHAEPYVVRRTIMDNEVDSTYAAGSVVGRTPYYGPATLLPLPVAKPTNIDVLPDSPVRSYRSPNSFDFVSPSQPETLVSFRLIDSALNPDTENNSVARQRSRSVATRIDRYERMEIEPTNFNQEWRTPPLWGLRDSAPYMHDGRAETLLESIAMHDGEAAGTRDRFLSSSYEDRQDLIAFLETLVAP
ncbi:di-heme oxidoredictase family protein [Aporhodopirellula aestuarii]|uniref:Cytochrome c domain-containing protein n=1 Tax=Aporhodopirellula aestuarii TaxID=2950107 RepID=A0ABT0U2S3_9BACT|nr:di-heme oxidoredictase family protein [Aporhodopirellula aestuarii]MCM2371103.1 hypothetical protein [Aporhodopirellula aestuarii]